MNCLIWNYHRLGNPQTEGELVALIGKKDPKLVFLMETKVDRDGIARICRKLLNFNFFVVPRITRGGGLAFLWKNDMNMIVCNSFDRYIDAVIDHGMNDAWRFTGFYGDPDTTSRENS